MRPIARHVALIPAAGSGQRFGASLPKQYALLAGKPMLVHTVQALLDFDSLEQVVVLVSGDDLYAQAVLTEQLSQYPNRLQLIFKGGDTRAQTVRNGLAYLQSLNCPVNTWVWVHDAARPGVQAAQLNALALALSDMNSSSAAGAVLASPVADTLKAVTHQTIAATVDRQGVWQAQTPQCFGLKTLCAALDAAVLAGHTVTDEASAVELQGMRPRIVYGSSLNFKVTTPDDAVLMEAVLSTLNHKSATVVPAIRIGEGMDVHALVEGRPLILGGVTIPHSKGLLGHSDADALLHAITDALLGAAGMGDIGRMFPDTDAQFLGADSQRLLSTAYAKVQVTGWQVINVDATIVAQAPKMSLHILAMQANIARCLNVDPSRINIKAKTNEKLGWLGREEGIETRAVVMLQHV